MTIRVVSTALLRRKAVLALCVAFGSTLIGEAVLRVASGQVASQRANAPVQSDDAAVQAMRNVIANSGGLSVWREIRSAHETFSLLRPGEKTPQTVLLLDDWSQETTRYRRKLHGQTTPPPDHNGAAFYTADIGSSKTSVREPDQARVLATMLPAAAAEVMLRRHEYILKVSRLPHSNGEVCVDIFRTSSPMPMIPEQQWTITSATGLPSVIRYLVPTVGSSPIPLWKEVHYLQFSTQGDVVLPASVMTKLGSILESWTLVSFKSNPGFDVAKFDQEVAQ